MTGTSTEGWVLEGGAEGAVAGRDATTVVEAVGPAGAVDGPEGALRTIEPGCTDVVALTRATGRGRGLGMGLRVAASGRCAEGTLELPDGT